MTSFTNNKLIQLDPLFIDTSFNFYSDAGGGDPDSTSPTLRKYHSILWSKQLPNGKTFEITNKKSGVYLHHSSEIGEFFLGSDAITHSYSNHKRKQWLISQIKEEINDFFDKCSSIGAYIIFPNNRIEGKQTINAARGCNSFIDDRFDLTLECIRLFYLGQKSPLYDILLRYKNFFDLFGDFTAYTHFFLLQDLVDQNGKIKFYLPFDDFKTRPSFSNTYEYLTYKEGVLNFVLSRTNKIENYVR